MNIQDWFPLGWTGLILQSKGFSRVFSSSTIWKDQNTHKHSVQFCSVTQSCPTPCDPMNHSMPGLPVYHWLPELTHTHAHWVGDAIQPSHLLSAPSPPALNLSQHQGLFQWVSSLPQEAKYWSFSFNISPSNEHPGLISFRMDWLDLLAGQGTLKSLLQHHSSKAQFFGTQLFSQSNSHIHTWPQEKP